MEIQKSVEGADKAIGTPGEEDLALINTFTRRELAADEVYVFQVKLCDNEVDRDGERFSTACLEGLKGLLAGKTGMFDHSGKSGDQVMRIYDAWTESEDGRLNSVGEAYCALCAKVYLPRTDETAGLIAEIDAGIKKEVSISCAVKSVKCSACGKQWGREGCTHRKGVRYGDHVCHALLEEPTDAYEFSFVAVPAQPAAGVLRKKKSRSACTEEIERLAEDGRTYRAQLLEKTMRAGGLAMPEMERGLLRAMCGGLDAAQLKQLHDTLRARAAQALPLCPQLVAQADNGGGNEGFRV